MPSGKRKAPAGAPRSDLSLKERRRRSAGALAAGLRQDSPPARAEPTTRAATKRASVQGGAGVAVDPEREWLAAQARRLEDAGDGTFEASVITLATAFDRNKDQVLDEAEWNELVHDMLCVRDGVAAVAPSTAKNAAAVLARDGFAGIVASGATGVGFAAIIALARRWCDVLLAPAVRASLGGPPRLKLLHDPTLMDDIVRLRELRALPRAPARPVERRWVFARQGEQDAEWVGQPLSSYQLEGQDGWHLCDHKNGEGVVYWWPAAAERSADATLVAMPIELLAVDPAGSAPSDKLQRTFSWPPPPAATTFTKIQDAMRACTDMFANEPSKQTTRETAEVAAVYDCVDRRLAELGLAAVEVGGEGDCFFRALAHQLYGMCKPHVRYSWLNQHTQLLSGCGHYL